MALAEAQASITATLHVTAAQRSADLLDEELLAEAERDSLLGALEVASIPGAGGPLASDPNRDGS